MITHIDYNIVVEGVEDVCYRALCGRLVESTESIIASSLAEYYKDPSKYKGLKKPTCTACILLFMSEHGI